MNDDLVATLTAVSANLLDVFGAPATLTHAGTTTPVLVVLESAVVPVGEFGERMEQQTTVEILTASGATVGDTFTVGFAVWTAVQLLSDDGYIRKFAVRSEP